MNYLDTVGMLRNNQLIEANDKWVVGLPRPNVGWAVLFGAIGSAIANSGRENYIIAVNDQEFKFFEVDKKTGQYLEVLIRVKKESIRKVVVAKRAFNLKSEDEKFNIMIPKKIRKFNQSAQIAEFIEVVKQHKVKK